jgi:hypothetical protein
MTNPKEFSFHRIEYYPRQTIAWQLEAAIDGGDCPTVFKPLYRFEAYLLSLGAENPQRRTFDYWVSTRDFERVEAPWRMTKHTNDLDDVTLYAGDYEASRNVYVPTVYEGEYALELDVSRSFNVHLNLAAPDDLLTGTIVTQEGVRNRYIYRDSNPYMLLQHNVSDGVLHRSVLIGGSNPIKPNDVDTASLQQLAYMIGTTLNESLITQYAKTAEWPLESTLFKIDASVGIYISALQNLKNSPGRQQEASFYSFLRLLLPYLGSNNRRKELVANVTNFLEAKPVQGSCDWYAHVRVLQEKELA